MRARKATGRRSGQRSSAPARRAAPNSTATARTSAMRGRKSAASAARPTSPRSAASSARVAGCCGPPGGGAERIRAEEVQRPVVPGGIAVEVEQRGQRQPPTSTTPRRAHVAARPAAPPTAAASAARTAEVDGHVPDAGRERLGMRQACSSSVGEKLRQRGAARHRLVVQPDARQRRAEHRQQHRGREGQHEAAIALPQQRERPREGGPLRRARLRAARKPPTTRKICTAMRP